MKTIILSLVIFVVLQFVHAANVNDMTLAEWRRHVLTGNYFLKRAVETYRKQGYYTMADIVRERQLSDNTLNQIAKLPADGQLDKTSRLTFNSMKSFSFYFLKYYNAIHISDGLKVGALSVAVEAMKRGNDTLYSNPWRTYNELPMTSKYIIDKVVETIRLEENVFSYGKLEKSSLELEKLYATLREIDSYHGNQWFADMEEIKLLHDRCDGVDSGCSDKLKKAIGEYDVHDRQVKDLLPIDSKVKVDGLLHILEKDSAFQPIYDILREEKLWCIIGIDGCEKKTEDN